MSVTKKHMATLLLGAAAGLAAFKYYNMTPEEREKLASDLKEKANQLKGEAEGTIDKAKDYFEELKTKGTEALNETGGDLGKLLQSLFSDKPKDNTNPTDTAPTA